MTVRITVVSAVRHAADYLRILGSLPDVKLVAVVEEPDAPGWMREDSRRTAERAGVPYVEDVAAALDPARTDLVVVCSEPTRHARLALAALEAGLDVLVDKPVATTLTDADALAAAARAAGRTCAVVNRTHAPALRRARAWVDAGHVGLPRHLDLEFLASGAHFGTSVERPELVTDVTLSGGGEMMNFLGYLVDAVHHLTGLGVVEVDAMAGALFLPTHVEAGVEDTAVVSLLLERDVTATLTLGRVPYTPAGTPTASSIRLLGSHGHLVVDDESPAPTLVSGAGLTRLAADAGQVAAEAYLRHVVESLVAGTAPDYSVEDARATLEVVEAAYRSVAEAAPVRLG